MKIALIIPPVWTAHAPSLSIAYLKSFLNKHSYEAKCFDFNIELFQRVNLRDKAYWEPKNLIKWQDNELYMKHTYPDIIHKNINYFLKQIQDYSPQVVGITTNSVCFTLMLAKKLKEIDSKITIILGGQAADDYYYGHVIKQSDHVDIIVKGEGEKILLQLIKRIEFNQDISDIKGCFIKRDGKFLYTGDNQRHGNIDDLPFPDFKDFDLTLYSRYPIEPDQQSNQPPMLFSRGCPNACDFCLQRMIWKNKLIVRSPQSVWDEMIYHNEQHGITDFNFNDLLLNGSPSKLNEFCDISIKSNYRFSWSGNCTISTNMSPAIFDKMKNPYTINYAKEFLSAIHSSGTAFSLNFIIGHPSETRDDFLSTMSLLLEMREIIKTPSSPSMCTIHKESDIYNKYKNNDDFVYYDPLDWSYRDNTLAEREYRANIFKLIMLSLDQNFRMVNFE